MHGEPISTEPSMRLRDWPRLHETSVFYVRTMADKGSSRTDLFTLMVLQSPISQGLAERGTAAAGMGRSSR